MDALTRLLVGFGIIIFLITVIYSLSRYLYDKPELKVFSRFFKLKNPFPDNDFDKNHHAVEEISFMKKLKDAQERIKKNYKPH